jgi:photosystem II stability/assembly factor-like uncharacterized protein
LYGLGFEISNGNFFYIYPIIPSLTILKYSIFKGKIRITQSNIRISPQIKLHLAKIIFCSSNSERLTTKLSIMKKLYFTLLLAGTICHSLFAQNWNLKDLSDLDIGQVTSIFFSTKDNGVLTALKIEGNQNTGYILRTVNGGNTWSIVNTTDVAVYTDLHFFDEMNGLIIGYHEDNGIGSWQCTTSDGGDIWDCNFISGTHNHSTDLLFLDDSLGFAIGGDSDHPLLRTMNTGQTWERITLSDNHSFMQGIDFPSNTVGYVAGAYHQSIIPYGGDLFKTTNSGADWDLIYQDSTQPFSKIKFFDEENGLLFTTLNLNILGYLNGGCRIKKTSDGGFTWQQVLATPLLHDVTDAFISENGLVYAVGNGHLQTGGVILKSEDYGENWTVSFVVPNQNTTFSKAHHDRFNNRLHISAYDGYYTLDNVLSSTKQQAINPDEIQVYPNPVNGFLNIILKTAGEWNLSLFNSYGQLAYSAIISQTDQVFDLQDLPSGSYFARIMNTGGQVVFKKIVVT